MIEKKKFFDVEIPLLRSKVSLLAKEISDLNKRNIKMDLTRMLRGQSLEAVLRIKVEGEKATATPIRLIVPSSFIARTMRNAISYVEDSFSAECTDGQLQIKPFMITRKKVHREVRKALRNEAKRYIQEYMKNKCIEEIFSDIINSRLQRPLSLKLKKIYPLAFCEIRQLKIEKEKEKVEVEKIKIEKAEEVQQEKETVEEEQIEQEEENQEEKKEQEEERTEQEKVENEIKGEKAEEKEIVEEEIEVKEEKKRKPRKKKEK